MKKILLFCAFSMVTFGSLIASEDRCDITSYTLANSADISIINPDLTDTVLSLADAIESWVDVFQAWIDGSENVSIDDVKEAAMNIEVAAKFWAAAAYVEPVWNDETKADDFYNWFAHSGSWFLRIALADQWCCFADEVMLEAESARIDSVDIVEWRIKSANLRAVVEQFRKACADVKKLVIQ